MSYDTRLKKRFSLTKWTNTELLRHLVTKQENDMSMPPMQIIMLIEIHCFVFMDQLSTLNGSPASTKILSRMFRDNLIERVELPEETASFASRDRHPYRTTERGKVLLEKLCGTPLPVLEERWV